jgi:tetratricopeptide (TPR) repeat protein
MLLRGIVIAGLIAVALVPALSARTLAASQQDYDDCSQSADINRGVAACTRVIEDQAQSAADRAGAYLQRGNDDVASGKLDDGIADYGAAIQLDQKNVLAYAARAIAYWRKTDRNRAVADYKQAAGIDAANILEITLPNAELKAIRKAAREGLCGLAAADWTTTESVATVAAYQDHLARFAVCAYAAIGQRRIAALTQAGSLQAVGEVDRGHLGIQIKSLTPETASKVGLKIPRGAQVVDVDASSPASQAGVQKDDVIIQFDDDQVEGPFDLAAMTSSAKPGVRVKLTLIRSGAEKAIDLTLGSQRAPPEAAVAYMLLGNALAAKQDLDDAIADYNKALTIDPEDAYALGVRGSAYLSKKDFKRAISDLSDAVDKGIPAYLDLANAYLATSDFDRAMANYDQAIQRFPTWAVAFYDRGLVKQQNGDGAGAAADFAKAKELGFKAAGDAPPGAK